MPPFKTIGLLCNKFKGGKDKVMLVLDIRIMLLVLGEIMPEGRQGWLNVIIVKVKVTWIGNALNILTVSHPKIDYLLEEFYGELTHINLIPPGIKEADFDPEEEICLIKELLYDNSTPRPP
ncbi:hypothetical protein Tco_0537409 [Tanacetum coccineum]